jgi:hypothetical protein
VKKILIISYFFPPANFVGAERTAAWAKYLHESGYYPIILTRCWNEGQTDIVNPLEKNQLIHEVFKNYEVYRIPVPFSFRDKIASLKGFKLVRKFISLLGLISPHFFFRISEYKNFYKLGRRLLKQDPNISIVISSGKPFHTFSLGYRLKKEFKNILWIPDYRDEWTTHSNPSRQDFFWKMLKNLDRISEKKWTSNADAFITVSERWLISIQNLIKVKGFTIINGYDGTPPEIASFQENQRFIITYAGTLYPAQPIEVFIDSVKFIIDSGRRNIKINFIGTNIVYGQSARLRNLVKGYEDYFVFVDRIEKNRLKAFISGSDLLILTSFKKVKGWYPVKLFDYFLSGKPILLCPTDKDVIEDFIYKTNSGFICSEESECIEIIKNCMDKKDRGETIVLKRNLAEGSEFSRQYQTRKLGLLLDDLIKNQNSA